MSAYKQTQIGFIKITKIGHKYLYGITLWNREGDGIKEGHTIKYDLTNLVIYPGIRHDLKNRLNEYEEDYRQWQLDRNKRDREVDWEIKNLKEQMMDAWKDENPMPQVPVFPHPD